MSISRPNIVQQENQLRSLPDQALRTMLLQMGQTGQVGSPEYLLAAGEMQARKNIRQQAQMGQPQQPPVIAELLAGAPMQGQGQPQPQGQPMPAEAGVAALPAQNLEALDQPQYADGGIVAFSNGGSSSRVPTEAEVKAAYERWMSSKPSFFMPTPKGDLSIKAAEDEYTRLLQAFQSGRPVEGLTPLAVQQAQSTIAAKDGVAAPSTATAPDAGAGGDKGITQLPAAKTAPVGGGLISQTRNFMDAFYPVAKEPAPTLSDVTERNRAAYEAAGVDFDPNKELREQIMEERANRAGDKEKAGWQALAQFGLTLASTPGDFLSAVGKAGLPALKEYASEVKELKKLARDDDRLISQLKAADNQLKANFTQKNLDSFDKLMEQHQTNQARAGQIAATVAGGITSLEASKEGRADIRKDTMLKSAREEARKQVEAKIRRNPLLGNDPKFDYEGEIDAIEAQILANWGLAGKAAPQTGGAKFLGIRPSTSANK